VVGAGRRWQYHHKAGGSKSWLVPRSDAALMVGVRVGDLALHGGVCSLAGFTVLLSLVWLQALACMRLSGACSIVCEVPFPDSVLSKID
jgi:hypothetical protein